MILQRIGGVLVVIGILWGMWLYGFDNPLSLVLTGCIFILVGMLLERLRQKT